MYLKHPGRIVSLALTAIVLMGLTVALMVFAPFARAGTGVSAEKLLHGETEWVTTQEYVNLVNAGLVANGKPEMQAVYIGLNSEADQAMRDNLNTLVVSVEQTMRLINGSQETGPGSRFKPAYELGAGSYAYLTVVANKQGVSYTPTDAAQLRQACYGGYVMQLFGRVTGLSMEQKDIDAMDEWIARSTAPELVSNVMRWRDSGIAASSLATCDGTPV